jgi:trehalose synthase
MTQLVDVARGITLDDYAAVGHLAQAVTELREEAAELSPRLAGRTVWMVNSTATGGGVAEMLPTVVTLLDELGVTTRWAVIESDRPEFFVLTKRLHNMIHGVKEPKLQPADKSLYDAVSRANADALLDLVSADDIIVIHDPQPLGAGALVTRELGAPAVWRCHIGLDEHLPPTRAAWSFLAPYAAAYDRAIFSSEAYVPDFLRDRSTIAHPTVDPLDHKNRELSLHKLVGILCSAGLSTAHWPLVTPPFPELPRRLQVNGSFAPGTVPEDIGLIGRPIVTQVSRWDRLKGFSPLLEAFRALKLRPRDGYIDRHRRQIDAARLVLAGPSPESIQDDPEALEVLDELCALYVALEPEIQRDVALLTLPMSSRKFNALMVNALQRASSIVVQNSLREGFGLTATEAMWKSIPVVGNTRAVGLREQIRDGIDGRLISDPEDAEELADALDELLADPEARERYGRNAHRRVRDEFLIFTQLRQWLRLLADVAEERRPHARRVARTG